jgi:hypothetical protein
MGKTEVRGGTCARVLPKSDSDRGRGNDRRLNLRGPGRERSRWDTRRPIPARLVTVSEVCIDEDLCWLSEGPKATASR